ncbi:putative splicing factor U2AF 23 kDa subunit [[Candida] jaroonii]|uniref:Splicing factor U2AF 23 kDa subunit n=1 Tax=[Candida] jaroonii TaxID=467808 RepID=A0ACA9YCU9_9ASCO|nr:putative splicing factor U2AF 23 kDa subunit [[Candida] jaroonii]
MDKSTCQFYTKIGACRHGEKCSRKHIKPTRSRTILLPNLYQNPKLNKNEQDLNPIQITEVFENFYKDILIRFAKIDEVITIVICENENNHLNGNVYVKFKTVDGAIRAINELNNEWFGSRPVHCELSPVENFPDANCKAYDTNSCTRGDHCNFMHVIRPKNELKDYFFKCQEKTILLNKIEKLKQTKPQDPAKSDTKDFQSTVANLFKAV